MAVTLAVMDASPCESQTTALSGSDAKTSGTEEPMDDMDRDMDRDEDQHRDARAATAAPPGTEERASRDDEMDPPVQQTPGEPSVTTPQGNPPSGQGVRSWVSRWMGTR